MDNIKVQTNSLLIKPSIQIKQRPYVGEDGIYIPIQEYVPEGCSSDYRMIMPKEMFVEAYKKWIEGETK